MPNTVVVRCQSTTLHGVESNGIKTIISMLNAGCIISKTGVHNCKKEHHCYLQKHCMSQELHLQFNKRIKGSSHLSHQCITNM